MLPGPELFMHLINSYLATTIQNLRVLIYKWPVVERLIYKWSTEVYCAIVASQFIVILLTVGLTRGKVVELEWCID